MLFIGVGCFLVQHPLPGAGISGHEGHVYGPLPRC